MLIPAKILTTLLTPGERILVAISGGVDSLALLHLLAGLRGQQAGKGSLRTPAEALHDDEGRRPKGICGDDDSSRRASLTAASPPVIGAASNESSYHPASDNKATAPPPPNANHATRITLLAAHVHHGMRGEAADADVEYLRRLCTEWGVPLFVVHRDVPALAAERRISVEEAGRIARYEALESLAREHGCAKVVTAHHADDQVETVLLHLLRGTGLDGLRGMPERRPLSPTPGAPELVRPLLGIWRQDLEDYCREHGLEPRHDWTNEDLRYRRNRLRREVIPLLETLAPAAKQHLLQLALQAQDEVAVLEPLAADLLQRARRPAPEPWRRPGGPPEWLVRERTTRPTALDASLLAQAPRATARRALRLLVRENAGPQVELSFEPVEQVLRLAEGDETAVDLPECGLRARRSGELLLLEAQHPAPQAIPEELQLTGPGEYTAPAMGLRMRVEVSTAPAVLRLPPDEACLAEPAVHWPLRLRTPRRGERFQPLGAPGSRLLSDLFVDRKIPAEARALWPLLEDEEGILWVCGLAVAERARVVSPGDPCLRLRIESMGINSSDASGL